MLKKIFIFTAVILAASEAHARHEAADTLDVATVTAEKGLIVSRTDTIALTGSRETAGQLMCIPGLSITDLGGNAGLKTASLRGLGTAHTAIFIDGIRVGNQQNGQPDLGMIGAGFFKAAIIDYAQNSIDFISAAPRFCTDKNGHIRKTSTEIEFSGGSFGTYSPSLKFGWRISDKVIMSMNAGLTASEGNYPYTAVDESGNTSEMRRTGNDSRQIRAAMDFFGDDWKLKVYAHSSERGAPGSVSWPSEDRQNDRNILMQGSINRKFGKRYQLKASAKGSYDIMDYLSSWGDTKYEQMEFQMNTSHIFTIKEWWKASFAIGGQSDKLLSGNYGTSEDGSAAKEGITRMQIRSSAAMRFTFRKFKGEIALEHEWSRDREQRRPMLTTGTLSPSASLRFHISESLDLVAFGRRACRLPMFNELYYIGFGNKDLKPEDAWLTDIGAEWTYPINSRLSLSAKADGFFNWLENKITSAPGDIDPNIWLPYNIGKVFSSGHDISASVKYSSGDWTTGLSARHTLQNARDKTIGSTNYGKQLAYVARNSFVIIGDAAWKGWRMDLRFNLRSGRSDSTGEMPDWHTLDASFSKEFSPGKKNAYTRIKASLTANNLTGTQYELSRGYPMPGRSILAGIAFIF